VLAALVPRPLVLHPSPHAYDPHTRLLYSWFPAHYTLTNFPLFLPTTAQPDLLSPKLPLGSPCHLLSR
jgi:hypothetical protein